MVQINEQCTFIRDKLKESLYKGFALLVCIFFLCGADAAVY